MLLAVGRVELRFAAAGPNIPGFAIGKSDHAQALANSVTAVLCRSRARIHYSQCDNDSGGILTYSQAGAQYGYNLLWTMIPITIALIVVQEMCARMGVVTGKGLSDLIREEFGLRLTFVLMVVLVIVNYTNVVTEFIGIAGSLHLFHVTKFISVPLCAALVWVMVVKGNYKSTEKIFLVASRCLHLLHLCGRAVAAELERRAARNGSAARGSAWRDKTYMYMAIGIVGTTIAPWMQFYLQSSIVEKGIRVKDYSPRALM